MQNYPDKLVEWFEKCTCYWILETRNAYTHVIAIQLKRSSKGNYLGMTTSFRTLLLQLILHIILVTWLSGNVTHTPTQTHIHTQTRRYTYTYLHTAHEYKYVRDI